MLRRVKLLDVFPKEECGGSVVESLTLDQGMQVRASPEALRCVFILCLVLVQPRKTLPNMTEKLLIGTLRIKTNKQTSCFNGYNLMIYIE